MATLKQRLHRLNSSGTYDVVHLETSAELVKRTNGTTVEASLSAIEALNLVEYEDATGESVDPFNPVIDASTLQGHPASDFMLAGGTASSLTKPTIGAVGSTLTWAGYTWRVVHDDGKLVYLMTDAVLENIQFSDGSIGYIGSKIHQRCLQFAADTDITNCAFVADIMGGKVFIAGYDQMNGGFSYFSSNNARIGKLNGSATFYWTSSNYWSPSTNSNSNGGVYRVDTAGYLGIGSNRGNPSEVKGFRPCVALIK